MACRRIISASICAWSLAMLPGAASLVSQDKLDLFHFVKYHYVAALTTTGRCGHKRSAGVVFCASRISRTRHVRLTVSPTHNCVVYSFLGNICFCGTSGGRPLRATDTIAGRCSRRLNRLRQKVRRKSKA